MKEIRSVTLTPYARQYICLLIVSLVCNSLGHHVSFRSREREARNISNPDSNSGSLHRFFDSCLDKRFSEWRFTDDNDDVSTGRTSTETLGKYWMRDGKRSSIEILQFHRFRNHKHFRVQPIRSADIISSDKRTLRRNEDFHSSPRIARNNMNIKAVRPLPVDKSTRRKLMHRFSLLQRELLKNAMLQHSNKNYVSSKLTNRAVYEHHLASKHVLNIRTRLNAHDNFQPELEEHSRRHALEYHLHANKEIQNDLRTVPLIENSSRSLQKFNMLDHFFKSRKFMHSTPRRLLRSNARRSTQKNVDTLHLFGEMTVRDEEETRKERNNNRMRGGGGKNIQRQYMRLISNSIFRFHLETTRLLLNTFDYNKSSISMNLKFLKQRGDNKLHLIRYTLRKRNDSPLQRDSRVRESLISSTHLRMNNLQEKPTYIRQCGMKIKDDSRVNFINNKNIENLSIVNESLMVDYFTVGKEIMSKQQQQQQQQRFSSNIVNFSTRDSLVCQNHHNFPLSEKSSKRNREEHNTKIRERISRRNMQSQNNIRKVIARKIIVPNNHRLLFRKIDKNIRSIELRIKNVTKESAWRNEFPIKNNHENGEYRNIYGLFFKHDKSILYRKDVSNVALRYVIIIVLYALHGSFLYDGRKAFPRNVHQQINRLIAWCGV